MVRGQDLCHLWSLHAFDPATLGVNLESDALSISFFILGAVLTAILFTVLRGHLIGILGTSSGFLDGSSRRSSRHRTARGTVSHSWQNSSTCRFVMWIPACTSRNHGAGPQAPKLSHPRNASGLIIGRIARDSNFGAFAVGSSDRNIFHEHAEHFKRTQPY